MFGEVGLRNTFFKNTFVFREPECDPASGRIVS